MPSEDAIERGARALHAQMYSNTLPWDHRRAQTMLKDKCRRYAELVLTAAASSETENG